MIGTSWCSGKPFEGKGVLPEKIMFGESKARTTHAVTVEVESIAGVHQNSTPPFRFLLTFDCLLNHLEECGKPAGNHSLHEGHRSGSRQPE